jgi:hypothetical protein
MKSIFLLFVPLMVFATGETLTFEEHMSIHNSNHRPSIKLKKKRQMHRLSKLNEQDAQSITKKETKEESQSIRLTHRGKHLMFKVHTENYLLSINALDGTIIKREKKD